MKKILFMLTVLFALISAIMGLILTCVMVLDTVNRTKDFQKNVKSKACRYVYNKIASGLDD